MKVIDQFKNKKVLVLGLAKSGESAARLLDKLGAIVTVNDGKPFEDNPAAQSLLEEGIKVITGGHPLELLDEEFALMVKNPGIPYSNPMIEKALAKGIPVLTEVELAYLISEAPIIGITGSNGKTTTTTMIGSFDCCWPTWSLIRKYRLSCQSGCSNSDRQGHACHGTFFFPTHGRSRIPSRDCGYYQPHANSYRLSWFF